MEVDDGINSATKGVEIKISAPDPSLDIEEEEIMTTTNKTEMNQTGQDVVIQEIPHSSAKSLNYASNARKYAFVFIFSFLSIFYR